MYMVKITADADWQIFPVYYFGNESDVDYIMRKRGIKGFCLPVMKIPAWKKNDFWNIVKTMNLKH